MKTHPAADYLATRNWKNASIELDGEDQNITVFDWHELEEKCDNDPERVTWVTDFYEYFADDDTAIDKIEDGEWLPLAVLGMVDASLLSSFAEINNGGFLAIVLKGSEFPKGSVIHFSAVTAKQVADSVEKLPVRLKSPLVAKSKEKLSPEQQAEKDRRNKESLKEGMAAAPDDHGAAALYANFLLEKESNFAEALKMAVHFDQMNKKLGSPKPYQLAYPMAVRGLIAAKQGDMATAAPLLKKAAELDAMLVKAYFREFAKYHES